MLLFMAITSVSCYAGSLCSMMSQDMILHFYMQGSGAETGYDPNEFVIVDNYHTDIEVSYTASGWDFHLSHDSPGSPAVGERIELADGLLYGNQGCHIANIPSGFEFTGSGAGDDLWVLPQNAYNNSLPLGFAAQLSNSYKLCNWNPNDASKKAIRDAKWIRVKLKEVRGPENGNFSVWQTGPVQVYMSTFDSGITGDDVFYLTDTSHTHVNWGFSEPGYYEVEFEVSTVCQCDEMLYSDIWPLGNDAYNGDCKVDINDFVLLAQHWLERDCLVDSACAIAEIYPIEPEQELEERQIDINDLAMLAQEWLECVHPGCE